MFPYICVTLLYKSGSIDSLRHCSAFCWRLISWEWLIIWQLLYTDLLIGNHTLHNEIESLRSTLSEGTVHDKNKIMKKLSNATKEPWSLTLVPGTWKVQLEIACSLLRSHQHTCTGVTSCKPVHGCRIIDRIITHVNQELNSCVITFTNYCLQCFDAVGWAAGRASSL